MHERIRATLSALAALATTALAVTTAGGGSAAAAVATASKSPAIVSLGDSYISGEAGRWAGNGNSWQWGSAYGTDRAASNCIFSEGWCSHTASTVYGPSNPDDQPGNACDRSDVAEIEGAGWQSVSGLKKINLACSGATSADVISATFKTEPPQADQLASVAQADQVKMIVLSIGGNDLGFSSIMQACVKAYATGATCSDTQDAVVKQRLATVQSNITNSIDKIRSTMSAAGYADSAYTLVVQSYPAPLPYGADIRDPQGNWSRANNGGCPFMDADANWTRDTVIPDLAATVRKAAANAANPPVFLDLSWAFNGHELCSSQAQQATSANSLGNQISASNAEWVRWIGLPDAALGRSGWTRQGDQQEFLHPNAFGQQALSTCLTKLGSALSGSSGREFSCFGGGQGSSPSQVSVQSYSGAVPAERRGSATTPPGPPTFYQGEATGGVTGMCLDDYGQSLTPGTPIDMYYCNGSAAQNWSAVGVGTFTLELGGMCADAAGTGNGAKVELNTCTGAPSQAWASRSGTLVNANSGRCLDDPGASRTSGIQLQLWDCQSGDYAETWALSSTFPSPGAAPGCTSAAGTPQMTPGQCLLPGGSLTQSFDPGTPDYNGQLMLTYQTDGNLVEYESYDEANCTDTYPTKCYPPIHHRFAIWSSNVYGYQNPGEAILQADGNFVVYNTRGQALWSTQTQYCGSSGCDQDTLKLQSDGNLVVYRSGTVAVWASGKFVR